MSVPVIGVAVEGRATAEAIRGIAAALETALASYERFTVLFDRRAMTAPTADGRAELQRWAVDDLPRLRGRCVGWADVFDARRAASLERAAEAPNAHHAGTHPVGGYPQRTFTDVAAARRWLSETPPR